MLGSIILKQEARYIGETNRHFNTRDNEHLFWDKNSHIFKRLSASKGCKDKCDISLAPFS